MDIIRIGNDINVTWSVFGRNGAKYSLTGKIHHLWLVSGPRKKEITAYSLQARNQIVFVVDGDEIHKYGTYKLVLQLKEPDDDTQDATYELTHVFQVVSETYPMRANKVIGGQCDIVVKSILKNVYISDLEGASAYEIAVNNGFEGTEAEWIGGFIASVRTEWPYLIFTRGDNSTMRVDLRQGQSSSSAVLTVSCNTANATIKIKGVTRSTYTAYYGEMVDVLVSAEGYDTWHDVVTMTQDHTVVVSLNPQNGGGMSGTTHSVCVTNSQGATITINGTQVASGAVVVFQHGARVTIDVSLNDYESDGELINSLEADYSKEFVLVKKGAAPDPSEDPGAYTLYFKDTLIEIGYNEQAKSTEMISNVSWRINSEDMPDETQDAQDATADTQGVNIPGNIIMSVGDIVNLL